MTSMAHPTIDSRAVVAAFRRHENIALQFSGGRDSTATLYLLRPFWDRLTVYHVDSGDQFPETRAVVDRVARDVPITIIRSDVEALREAHGLASDLVPADNTHIGRMVSGRSIKIIGRYECCTAVVMNPLHARMEADGVTLLVRGQRDEDYAAPPLRSGQAADGFEVLYPIQHWTGDDVENYLRANGLPVADFYREGITRASDCMTCTAWWGDGLTQYLRRHHPEQHAKRAVRLQLIRDEINHQAATLAGELEN